MKPRPTLYKGVQMRSRLESGFAMWLDDQAIEWRYEPQCLASARGQWLPDFLVTARIVEAFDLLADPDGSHKLREECILVDVKPRSPQDHRVIERWQEIVDDAAPFIGDRRTRAVWVSPESPAWIGAHATFVPVASHRGLWLHEVGSTPWWDEWWNG